MLEIIPVVIYNFPAPLNDLKVKKLSNMACKYEVVRSENGGCHLCLENNHELYLVREVTGGRLTALCSCCLLGNLEHYMLDNTREWPFLDKKGS